MSSQLTATDKRSDGSQSEEEYALILSSSNESDIDKDLWKIKSPIELLDEIRALQPQITGSSRA